MKGLIKIKARPRLESPNMIAAWPGVSDVSMIAATYLQKKLNFKELGEVEASYFFNPVGVLVKNSVVESPQFPQSKFYYWKNKRGESDIILFIGDDQPSSKGYEMANCVLDMGLKFNIKRIYTCAAALTHIHHTEETRVWGVGTTKQVAEEMRQYDLNSGNNLQIAGLNGLMLGIAKERGVEGVCLLGEVPVYTSRVQSPMAALAVLQSLVKILGIKVDLDELTQLSIKTKEKMKQLTAEAMGEYIDYFTEPIWEQNGGEEDEEDDYE